MASTHYKIFCRYYHATVNKAVVNDFQSSEYTWLSKDTMNNTKEAGSKKIDLTQFSSKNMDNTSYFSGESKSIPATYKNYADLTDQEKAEKIGNSQVLMYKDENGIACKAKWEEGDPDPLTADEVTYEKVESTAAYTQTLKKKYFFTLDDYNANTDNSDCINTDGVKRVFENMFIRYEDYLMNADTDQDKRTAAQLKNLKEARALDSAINEITIRETVTDNPKFDMMFIYDGIGKEEAAPAINAEFITYTTTVRKWKYIGSEIGKLPAKSAADLIACLSAGEIIEPKDLPNHSQIFTAIEDTTADTLVKGEWTDADFVTNGVLVNSLSVTPADSAYVYNFSFSGTGNKVDQVSVISVQGSSGRDYKTIAISPLNKNGTAIEKTKICFLTKDQIDSIVNDGQTITAAIYKDTGKTIADDTTCLTTTTTLGDDAFTIDEYRGNKTYKVDKGNAVIDMKTLSMSGLAEDPLEIWMFSDKIDTTTLPSAQTLEEAQTLTPYVYYDKFKRFEFSPWFVYSNCTSLKFAMDKAEELVNIVGVDNVIIGKVVDLTQYIEIA